MKKRWLILLLGFMFVLGCSDDDNNTPEDANMDNTSMSSTDESSGGDTSGENNNNNNDLTRIVVIGDSIGNGFGVATGFPTFLERMTGVPVVNNSRSGRLTGEGVGLVDGLMAQHNPSHLVVLLGTNDALRNTSQDAAASNLQTIINRGNAAGAVVLVGTLPPVTRNSSENARAESISSRIRGLSGARIVDLRSEMNASHIADGVHPNNNGQQVIAMNFAERM